MEIAKVSSEQADEDGAIRILFSKLDAYYKEYLPSVGETERLVASTWATEWFLAYCEMMEGADVCPETIDIGVLGATRRSTAEHVQQILESAELISPRGGYFSRPRVLAEYGFCALHPNNLAIISMRLLADKEQSQGGAHL